MSLQTPPDWAWDIYLAEKVGVTPQEFERQFDPLWYERLSAYHEIEIEIAEWYRKHG